MREVVTTRPQVSEAYTMYYRALREAIDYIKSNRDFPGAVHENAVLLVKKYFEFHKMKKRLNINKDTILQYLQLLSDDIHYSLAQWESQENELLGESHDDISTELAELIIAIKITLGAITIS